MVGAKKFAAEAQQEAAYDRAKREFESLEIGGSKSVAEYFARVHVILTKLTRHQVTTPTREIKRRISTERFNSPIPRRDSFISNGK